MFARFTESARQVVMLAQDEAGSLKHNFIGTELLLLVRLREERGVAARALDSLNVSIDAVRAEVGLAAEFGIVILIGWGIWG